MKKIASLTILVFILAFTQNISAETKIGKVYGKKTWTAYIGPKNKIYIKRGGTAFANKCSTGFTSYKKIVKDAYGNSYSSQKSVLTAIQRYLVKGKYSSYGCA